MSDFPLYDIVLQDVKSSTNVNNELSYEQKLELLNIIPTMDSKGHEYMFTIIRIYSLRNNCQKEIFDVPFDGEKMNDDKDIKFNLDKFPSLLQQMIYRFCKIHCSNQNN